MQIPRHAVTYYVTLRPNLKQNLKLSRVGINITFFAVRYITVTAVISFPSSAGERQGMFAMLDWLRVKA